MPGDARDWILLGPAALVPLVILAYALLTRPKRSRGKHR